MRSRVLPATLTILALSLTVNLRAETLRGVLVRSGIPLAGRQAADLAQEITSFAVLEDPELFVVGYYPEGASRALGEVLHVDLYRKSPKSWAFGRFQRREGDDGQPAFGGSVVRLERAADFLFLVTHVNPSASYTLVLDKGLAPHGSIYGWPLGLFRDGLVIYQHSEVHFAPTHYVEISVYDPRANKSWLIYPAKPYSPVREQHIAKVRAAYAQRGAEWFAANNHHMNPELFDNYLQDEVASHDEMRSLAFRIAFDNSDTWDYAEKLKLQRFGALARVLTDYEILESPPDGIFMALGQGLLAVKRMQLLDQFLALFAADAELQAMIRRATVSGDESHSDWRSHLLSLDARWGKPEVWKKIQAALTTPPETTEVVCIFRNVDQPQKVQYREMLFSAFQEKFGALSLEDCVKPAGLKKIFGE